MSFEVIPRPGVALFAQGYDNRPTPSRSASSHTLRQMSGSVDSEIECRTSSTLRQTPARSSRIQVLDLDSGDISSERAFPGTKRKSTSALDAGVSVAKKQKKQPNHDTTLEAKPLDATCDESEHRNRAKKTTRSLKDQDNAATQPDRTKRDHRVLIDNQADKLKCLNRALAALEEYKRSTADKSREIVKVMGERDRALKELDGARALRDQALRSRDRARRLRDVAFEERDVISAELDTIKKERADLISDRESFLRLLGAQLVKVQEAMETIKQRGC